MITVEGVAFTGHLEQWRTLREILGGKIIVRHCFNEFKLSKYKFKLSKYEFKLSKYEFKLSELLQTPLTLQVKDIVCYSLGFHYRST